MSNETKAVTPYIEQYPVLKSAEDMSAALSENLGGEALSAFDLDQVKIPSGGGTIWQIDSIDGEENLKAIEGIIVFSNLSRSYWADGIEDGGGGNPPDCYSNDCITGKGDPGGDCGACHLAQFGSSDKGEGQACKQTRQLFLLRPGDMLPTVVSIPPSSLKNAKQFFLRLASKGLPYSSVVTSIALEKAKNNQGIAYAKAVFSVTGKLGADEQVGIKSFSEGIKLSLAG